MFTLHNNLDVPLVAVLEVRGFSLDQKGALLFSDPPRNLNVEFGSNSFTIAPRDTHYVFYKADAPSSPAWFAIVSTLIPAKQFHANLRVAVVLPHFVYIFQKGKIRSGDVEVHLLPGSDRGQYRLGLKNVSEKLGRVESIQGKGFEERVLHNGLLVFPGQTRWVTLQAGAARRGRPEFRVRFAGGYSVKVPVSSIAVASR